MTAEILSITMIILLNSSLSYIISASFWRKLTFVHSLRILSSHIPVDYIYIPDEVMR